MKKLYDKGIITGALFVMFVISLGFNYWVYSDNNVQKAQAQAFKEQVDSYNVVIKLNNAVIDSLLKLNDAKDKKLAGIGIRRADDVVKDKKTQKEYEKLYKTIANTSSDTAQFNLLKVLLAKSKGLPVTRD